MSFSSVYKKVASIRFAVILAVVGLLFTVLGGILLLKPEGDRLPVSAVITDITETGSGEDLRHTVLVSYEVDGKKYESELGAYTSGWKVGDTVECKYDVEHPENISYGNPTVLKIVFLGIGLAALAAGIVLLVRSIRKPTEEYSQFARADESSVDPQKRAEIENSTEAPQDYVFHFTGKLNQSYVMKDAFGTEVFRADCGGIQLVKTTDYEFVNLRTGARTARKVGHTLSAANSGGPVPFPALSSSFKMDGTDCWDFLAALGYSMQCSLKGLRCRYEVTHFGVPVGSVETAGTEILDEKYAGNPLAKLPSAGLYRISCRPGETEGFFYICFCLSRTDTVAE